MLGSGVEGCSLYGVEVTGLRFRVKVVFLGDQAPDNKSSLLRGSCAVISRGISRVTILRTHIRGLTTPLVATHEPPSGFTNLVIPNPRIFSNSFEFSQRVKGLREYAERKAV